MGVRRTVCRALQYAPVAVLHGDRSLAIRSTTSRSIVAWHEASPFKVCAMNSGNVVIGGNSR